ncbi:type IV pilus modification PilV family protein [Leucobacter denitrificans]|uniref:Prepilin-type N-terminal cleavage/methylation domain-containing protein n=1 Tax=Leucobacter denitrificans TaxID=683042 RepID=A0A7G9S7D5_9MICO|nr:hypothetical protein [Leucobacter denitrificans]QNN63760.1 hypothetical protein H9L06_05635 [Leucobacter denitrificans]
MRRVAGVLRGETGLTMTELAVAIVLLSLVIAGLAPLMVNSVLLAQKNANVGEANRVAAAQLDETRSVVRGAACESVADLNASDLAISTGGGAEGAIHKLRVTRDVTCTDRLATVTISVFDRNATSAAPDPLVSATTQVVTAS